MSPHDLMKILADGSFGHLGCSFGGEVYIVPINYALDGDYIYAHSRQGHKTDIMRKNPRVCLQVEELKDTFHWRSVIAWGRYEELFGDEAAKAMRLLLRTYARKQPGARMSELEMDFAGVATNAVFFRLRIERMTGRQEGA
jgi:nitroimidazol reductase NimA-like FMN-containing flavoprotein (pyridoxamine 5'-phosphate oxidase superfamily)